VWEEAPSLQTKLGFVDRFPAVILAPPLLPTVHLKICIACAYVHNRRTALFTFCLPSEYYTRMVVASLRISRTICTNTIFSMLSSELAS